MTQRSQLLSVRILVAMETVGFGFKSMMANSVQLRFVQEHRQRLKSNMRQNSGVSGRGADV